MKWIGNIKVNLIRHDMDMEEKLAYPNCVINPITTMRILIPSQKQFILLICINNSNP